MIGYELEAPLVDADHFRPFWRRKLLIRCLYDDGALRWIEYRAASRYHSLAEAIAATSWGAMRFETTDRPSGHDGRTVHRIDAAGRLRAVRRQIGPVDARWCDQVIIAEFTWAELGRRYRIDPKTAKVRAIEAIALLPAAMWDRR